MVGALIRQLRVERNYSQAGLAHGICAASYLSKIEQGRAASRTGLFHLMRFICGFLGVNTATLREAAVQAYLPPDMRARVLGLFNVLASLGVLVSQLLAGALGEILPYRMVALLFALFTTICIFTVIIRNRETVRKIYEYEKQEVQQPEHIET